MFCFLGCEKLIAGLKLKARPNMNLSLNYELASLKPFIVSINTNLIWCSHWNMLSQNVTHSSTAFFSFAVK